MPMDSNRLWRTKMEMIEVECVGCGKTAYFQTTIPRYVCSECRKRESEEREEFY